MLISNEILFFYVISILYFNYLEAWAKLIYGNRQNKIRNLNKRGAVHVVNMARFGNINPDEVTYLFSSFSDILWYRNQT